MTGPRQLRAWARVIVRDVLIPGTGLYLVVVDPGLANLTAWQLPLVAGMLGTPLVAPRGSDSA